MWFCPQKDLWQDQYLDGDSFPTITRLNVRSVHVHLFAFAELQIVIFFYLQMWWRLCNLTHCFICSAQSHLQFIGCCFFVDLNDLFLLIQTMATLSWPPAWPCWRLLRSRRFLKEMTKSTKRFLSALSLPPTSGTPITYKIYKTGQHPLLCVIIILVIYLLEMRDLFSVT